MLWRAQKPACHGSRGGDGHARKGELVDLPPSGFPHTAFIFSRDPSHLPRHFDFAQQPRPGRSPRGTKRPRAPSDVDGPHTSGLYSKKRRLRGDLITSRLSQPFSQPATHILNREGQESGDKRFLKMATRAVDAIAAKKRRVAELNGTSMWRFSVMNRIRKRLGVGAPLWEPPRRGGGLAQAVQPREGKAMADAAVNAGIRTQALRDAQTASRAFPATSWVGSCVGGPAPSSPPDRLPTSPLRSHLRVSKPAALPLPSADVSAADHRTAPRIDTIRSPELGPTTDDMEDDSFGFLHRDYEDEDEAAAAAAGDVYSDFGAIFGGGGAQSPEHGDDGSYEEYLDELDGLAWLTR